MSINTSKTPERTDNAGARSTKNPPSDGEAIRAWASAQVQSAPPLRGEQVDEFARVLMGGAR